MSDIVAGPVLALGVSGGTGGFLVILLLCAAAVGLFVAMSGSLRRMRANVARGEFGQRPPTRHDADAGADADLGDARPAEPADRAGGDRIPPQR